jgi:hypothetical protein
MKQAEELARRLKALLSSSILSQLLQRTPPAALTAEQEGQLKRCCDVLNQLEAALHEAPSLRMQLADAMLKQQAACNIGSVVTWVQQQPEQQLSDLRAVVVPGHQGSVSITHAAGGATASVWAAGLHLVESFAVEAYEQNSESVGSCSLATTLTQQLDQSGEACSHNCNCTVR